MKPAGILVTELNLTSEMGRFRERLLDLTNRNPLLNYRRSVRRTVPIVEELPQEIFDRLVNQGKSFRLDPRLDEGAEEEEEEDASDDAPELSLTLPQFGNASAAIPRHLVDDRLQTPLTPERLEAVMRFVKREATTAIEETGVNYLYLALGMLAWRERDDSSRLFQAPLVLIPVGVERCYDASTGGFAYDIAWTEEAVQHNLSLAKRLEGDFGICLPELGEEQSPEAYFQEVAIAVSGRSGWELKREALLGFFSFHKLMMYADLASENWPGSSLAEDSLAAQMVCGADVGGTQPFYAREYDIDSHPLAQSLRLALDADSSQHSALCDILDGKSLVIEGPPGTGKSQTITNAIAAAIDSGKTVLFVAEKLAALEVVKSKLDVAGLGQFCLELHSDAASPRKVMESLKRRLEARFRRPEEVDEVKEQIRRKQQLISEYIDATGMRVAPHGEPLYDLFWRIAELRTRGVRALSGVSCEFDVDLPSFEDGASALEEFVRTLKEFPDRGASPWWGFFVRGASEDQCETIRQCLLALRIAEKSAVEQASGLDAMVPIGPQAWLDVADHVRSDELQALVQQAPQVSPSQLLLLLDPTNRQRAEQLCDTVHELRRLEENSGIVLGSQDDALRAAEYLLDGGRKALPPRLKESDIRRLRDASVWLTTARALLDRISMHSASLERVGYGPVRNLQEYEEAHYLLRLFGHSVAQVERLNDSIFLPSALKAYKDGITESERLRSLADSVEQHFHLPSVPTNDDLLKTCASLRAHSRSWLRFFSGEYRTAKKALSRFRRPESSLRVAAWVEALEDLIEYRTQSELFGARPELRSHFGEWFDGLETDWQRLKQLLDWAATAKNRGLTPHRVRELCTLRDERKEALVAREVGAVKADFVRHLEEPMCFDAIGISLEEVAKTPFSEFMRRIGACLDSLQKVLSSIACFAFDGSASLSHVLEASRSYLDAAQLRSRLTADAHHDSRLGKWNQGPTTQTDELKSAMNWCIALDACGVPPEVSSSSMRGEDLELLRRVVETLKSLQMASADWQRMRTSLAEHGEMESDWLTLKRVFVSDDSRVERLLQEMGQLPAWAMLSRSLLHCRRFGLSGFTDAVIRGEATEEDLEPNDKTVSRCDGRRARRRV